MDKAGRFFIEQAGRFGASAHIEDDLPMAIASLIDAVKYLRRGDAATCDEKLKRASRHLLQHTGPDQSCRYCHGEGVERILGRDNNVIERPCPIGCPTPLKRVDR